MTASPPELRESYGASTAHALEALRIDTTFYLGFSRLTPYPHKHTNTHNGNMSYVPLLGLFFFFSFGQVGSSAERRPPSTPEVRHNSGGRCSVGTFSAAENWLSSPTLTTSPAAGCTLNLYLESCLPSSTVNKQLHDDGACFNPTCPTHSVRLIGFLQAPCVNNRHTCV